MKWVMKMIQGALIGAGALLPGVSGGVLAVLFGVYKPLMRLLAHPFKELKNTIVELWPILVGFVFGYLLSSLLLGHFLENYESQSLAVFVGMAIGIMPSLFREAGEQGRDKKSYISLVVVFAAAFAVLLACRVLKLQIVPNFFWNMFGGAALALSVIVPGMSSSILMLPLQMEGNATFYGHVTGSIGSILKGNADMVALIAILLGAVAAFVLLTKLVDYLMNKHYSVMFHGIIGIVIASTIFTIPYDAFTASVSDCLIHLALVCAGYVATMLLDKMNSKVEKPELI